MCSRSEVLQASNFGEQGEVRTSIDENEAKETPREKFRELAERYMRKTSSERQSCSTELTSGSMDMETRHNESGYHGWMACVCSRALIPHRWGGDRKRKRHITAGHLFKKKRINQ